MADDVDSMQNQILKSLEKKTIDQEKRLADLEIRFTEVMARMDLIIKGMKWIGGLVALGLGLDMNGFVDGGI